MIGNMGLNGGSLGLKVEKIATQDGSEVSYCPERGGIITSIKLHGTEILYMDEETFNNSTMNVRGGIPILFPNSGPISSPKFPDLKQHGFARNAKWQSRQEGSGFIQTFNADDNATKIFPYDFKLSLEGHFNKDGSFSVIQTVQNTGQEAMPVSSGLHPYFRVPNGEKKNIKFNFEGGDFVEKNIELWTNDKAFKLDNPKVNDPNAVMTVNIPSIGTLLIDASKEYRRIWIWSLPGKDFICIEPVMRDSGGLINDPEIVLPGNILRAKLTLKLLE